MQGYSQDLQVQHVPIPTALMMASRLACYGDTTSPNCRISWLVVLRMKYAARLLLDMRRHVTAVVQAAAPLPQQPFIQPQKRNNNAITHYIPFP